MDKVKYIIKAYEKWVAKNPETVCDVETTAKWVSYFIAGRISDSSVVTELVYSLSNLLVLYNDRIIAKYRKEQGDDSIETETVPNDFCYRLKVMLTTLEYCEVFLEISAKRIFSRKGKWILISALQIFKAAGRFYILRNSTQQIITTPALPALNRRAIIKAEKNGQTPNVSDATAAYNKSQYGEQNFTFKLKRSGRVIRKVEGAPPLPFRSFKLNEELESLQRQQVPKVLTQAEYLYICKPLIHLASMGIFGEKSWAQYVISLAVDLASIRMYQKNCHLLSKDQQRVLSHRTLNLVMYLMRSPVYDRITKSKLDYIFEFVASRIPFLKMIAGPLHDYIPHYQSTYYYIWST